MRSGNHSCSACTSTPLAWGLLATKPSRKRLHQQGSKSLFHNDGGTQKTYQR